MGDRPTPDAPQPGKRLHPPLRPPSCRSQSAQNQLARARAVGLVTGPHGHSPRTHSQWVVGLGCTPQGRAIWRRRAPIPGHSTPKQEPPPPPRAPSCCPHSAQSQLARARCGVGDGSTRPHPPHPQPMGSGPRPHVPNTGGRGWESAQPWTPHTKARGAPPGRPRASPTARKASSQGQALPQGGKRPQARQGDEGTGPPPRELKRRSTGLGQETRRGANRLERPYKRPAPEPRVVRAPQ